MKEIFIYTDGGSRGNPGKSAIGVVLVNEVGNIIQEYGGFIGVATNNIAEYKALIKGLELASKKKTNFITCVSDSQLMIKQLTGEYKVNNKKLMELFIIVKKKETLFKKISYTHVNRTNKYIKIADSLVNKALNEFEK
jgi:ribonuclease HI